MKINKNTIQSSVCKPITVLSEIGGPDFISIASGFLVMVSAASKWQRGGRKLECVRVDLIKHQITEEQLQSMIEALCLDIGQSGIFTVANFKRALKTVGFDQLIEEKKLTHFSSYCERQPRYEITHTDSGPIAVWR